ncbi:DUF1631 family protein [Massilia glaciei]|uniref:DUF1631 domain-containing protein n=1 Tax=Massilia glaciei TaxID=1524097 RepID=A0A2U2HNH8_9BURK|nr:DUF1631 family protein [Massilia glaciei]PWF49068.1 DUF1631 domain-containing protein [Massilia glaciei]
MPQNEPLTHLAKAQALSGFAVLVKNMLWETDLALLGAVKSEGASDDDKRMLRTAHDFLRQQGQVLEKRIVITFALNLDRAMQTMYRDLRRDVKDLTADDLTLIDDEVVNRLIEVDRVVTRFRDGDQVDLGRISLSIARLHGFEEVRERENPFRPYLLARALHDGLRELVADDTLAKLLFTHLSSTMASQLPTFYRGIRTVFEDGGVSTELLAMRSPQAREAAGRAALAPGAVAVAGMAPKQPDAAVPHAPQASPVLPTAAEMAQRRQSAALHDFVWKVLNQPGAVKARAPQTGGGPADGFDARLRLAQKSAAQSPAAGAAAGAGAQPTLQEQVDGPGASDQDRMMAGMVDLLFDFVMRDPLIPPRLRSQLGRLQIPFLRASMAEPDLMHQPGHPARELIDRMAAAAIGTGADPAADQSMEARIEQLIGQLLNRFDGDIGVFKMCLAQFEGFLVRQLRFHDTRTALCGESIDEAESIAAITHNTTLALQDLLGPLAIDPRVFDFITGPWLEVLVHPLSWDPQRRGPESHAALRHRELLPELLWSAQEKSTAQERAELTALLPGLASRIRQGFELIGLDRDRAQQAMDQLVAVHADVLRGKPAAPVFGKRVLSMEQLEGRFHNMQLEAGNGAGADGRPVVVRPLVLRAALARREVAATLVVSYDAHPAQQSDAGWLRQMRVGTAVLLRIDANEVPARLSVVSPHGCLYMFSPLSAGAAPHIYSHSTMLKALQDRQIRPLEHAPLFDRAVASLIGETEEPIVMAG